MAAELGVSAASVSRHGACQGLEASPGTRRQGLARSQVRQETRRDRRSVLVATRACAGVVLRREKPGAGTRPYAARLATEVGRATTAIHGYKRNGTTHAVRRAQRAGQPCDRAASSNTVIEWLKFLRKIDRQTPKDKALHRIADNCTAACSPASPRWSLPLTTTSPAKHQTQTAYLDRQRSPHRPERHSCQQPLKFSTGCTTTPGSAHAAVTAAGSNAG